MEKDYIIRIEEEKDYFNVENLTREAFWNVYRPGCFEHYVLHEFRKNKDFIKELDFVLEVNNEIIGHIMFARNVIRTVSGEIPILTFGPFSISPKYKHKGYGTILLNYALEKAKEFGGNVIAITGNFDFYSKFGFVKGKDVGVLYEDDKDADYFLIKELKEGCLKNIKGYYKDNDGYFVKEEDVEEFDKLFPYKKKEILSGQL